MLDKPCCECNKRILREAFVVKGKEYLHESCAKSDRKIQSVVAPMAKMSIEKKASNDEEERKRLAAKINEGKVPCALCFKVVSAMAVEFQVKREMEG